MSNERPFSSPEEKTFYSYTTSDTITLLKNRKDPKNMSIKELDEYLHQNQIQNQQNTYNPTPQFSQNTVSTENELIQKDFYIQELETKLSESLDQNEELKNTLLKLSAIIENERNKNSNLKLIKENENLKYELSVLKAKINILVKEKERHLEQNVLDKEYYENQLKEKNQENMELKNEIQDKIKQFSILMNEQQKNLYKDFESQLKNYKELIKKYEANKKNLTKKYENKIKELTVTISRIEKEKNKIYKNRNSIDFYSSTTFSKINNNNYLRSSTSRSNRNSSQNNKKNKSRTPRKSNNNSAIKNRSNTTKSQIFSDSFIDKNLCTTKETNKQTCEYNITDINDNIFFLERNIAELKHNYTKLLNKTQNSSNSEESLIMKKNINYIQNSLKNLTTQLNDLKVKQQEIFLSELI